MRIDWEPRHMTSSAPASTPPLAFSDRGALSRAVIAHLTGSGEGCGHAALAEEAVAASADEIAHGHIHDGDCDHDD